MHLKVVTSFAAEKQVHFTDIGYVREWICLLLSACLYVGPLC